MHTPCLLKMNEKKVEQIQGNHTNKNRPHQNNHGEDFTYEFFSLLPAPYQRKQFHAFFSTKILSRMQTFSDD